MSDTSFRELLKLLCNEYPRELQSHQARNIDRMAFHISLALQGKPLHDIGQITVCDLGGGNTLLTPAFAALGAKSSILVDDLSDSDSEWILSSLTSPHLKHGVSIYKQDLINDGLEGLPADLNIVTCFNSMEHWHNSPKKLFAEAYLKLAPGGVFILSTPNCANLRKRITMLFGRAKWSALADWYEVDHFRGHVREPDLEDLVWIARDMGLINIKTYGRNWMGHYSSNKIIRMLTKIADKPLRNFPTLCSDIYVIGQKPSK
jgi:2-polyprenyl-3-methyl-5-hydroxy-6-metoxy-1,4-benzoquinol methylase